MQLFYQPLVGEGIDYLDEEESRHAVKVLRLREQDVIHVVDGKGNLYTSVITQANFKRCSFQVNSTTKQNPEKRHNIHIAIAPTKNPDRMEWFTEKAVEFGVDKITFLYCEHSERKHFNISRIEKKAISAMKQSLKAALPQIVPPIPFPQFIKQNNTEGYKFIAYVDEDIPNHLKSLAPPNQDYCILIGPEGDFSLTEIYLARNHHFTPVSLGKSRLRTETAGIAACMILNMINNF